MWLTTPTLQTRQSSKELVEFAFLTVADDQIARVACAFPPHKCLPRVEVKDLAGAWRVIATGPEYYRPQFINDNLLGIWGGNLLSLMALDGTLVSTRNLKGAGALVTSAGGKRFVVPIFTVKGHIAALDIDGHSLLKQILLYDTASRSWSHTLDIRGPNIKDKMDFALSPDGSRLAVLNNEILYLFALPPLQSAQPDTPSVQ